MTIYDAIARVNNKQPLFSALLGGLEPVEDKNVPTLGTDGEKLSYNPDFLDQLTDDEGAAVVLHETLHAAFHHVWRREKRDPMLWNIAADYAINGIVNENFPLPKGCLLDSKYYGMSAEQIYDDLKKEQKEKGGKGKDGQQQQSWCDKQSWSNSSKKGEKQDSPSDFEDGDDEGDDSDDITDKIFKKFFGKPRRSSKSSKETERKWKELFENTILKNYGKMPDSIKRVIEKSYYIPVIDWTELVANILSEDTTDYSFSVPDRRFLEADFTLPDMYSIDKLKDIVFAYDTSGSINNYDLFTFYMESVNLFNNFSSLTGWIGICDAQLHSFKEFSPQNSYSEFDFIGGGGTNFQPVFDAVKTKNLVPKALFYFTDCEGNFPLTKPTYPVFWLVRSCVGNDYTPEVPFGTVINFLPKK